MSDSSHLSHIVTHWSVVRRAHEGELEAVQSAQQQLLERYGGAVRRYLLAALKNEDAADEVFQEFALRFVRGDFQKADPGQGRFRSYLKTIVYRLIVDYQRRQHRQARQQALPTEGPIWEVEAEENSDQRFTDSWRDELLARGWSALRDIEQREGKPYYQILRVRAEHPELRSGELAEHLSSSLDKPLTSGNVRVLLHRARQRFGELLLAEIAHSLATSNIEQIEQELIDLSLHSYCRDAIRRQPKGSDQRPLP
jgi:RNA polymerase sigma factor (sigma-70 family)